MGVVTSAPFFKPKVELIIHESLREKSPLQLPVEIKNNSNFSLYDVESVMHTDRIVLAGNSVLTNTDLSGLDNKADRIRPDESFTFVETGMVLNGVPVAYGLVHFDVTYKFLWIPYSEEYHFKFAFGDNGKVVWMKRPKKID